MSSTVLGSGDIIAERYRIEGLLGQGGMGSVYRAVQLSMGRAVALKLLATEQPATRDQVERFEREAQALARLQHPSTVRLFDFGTVEAGRPFIVMELLGGADLEEELAHNGPMRWDQALRVCLRVLGSLGEAHALGLIHRDVKPANVYLCAGGPWPAVKLLDFGIAGGVELASTRKLTATGTVLGSVPYMSPEQAQGQPVGPGADLYALGVVLFEMLTGQTPFAGRGFTAQLVAKVLEPAPALLEVRPELALPPGLSELVAELLERDASRRPSCAHVLSERMAALLERHPLPALERPLPARQASAPSARTEPMVVPRTVADGWVPPSVPSAAFAPPPRRRRRGLVVGLALSLIVPALGLAWWPGERHEPAVAGGTPGPMAALMTRAAPEPDDALGAIAAGAVDAPVSGADAGSEPGAAELGEAAEGEATAAAGVASRGEGDERARAGSSPELVEALVAPPPAAGPASSGARRPGPVRPARTRPVAIPRVEGAGTASRQPAAAGQALPREVPAPSASAPEVAAPESGALPAASAGGAVASAGLPEAPSPASLPPAPAASASTGAPSQPLPEPLPSRSPWVEAQPSYAPQPSYTPRPDPEPIAERPAWWLLQRYPSVANASEAARAGEITPSERNTVVAELRRARQRERGRAIRHYRAGYISRGDLRDRLLDIDRRYEGAFEQYPPTGIHIWP